MANEGAAAQAGFILLQDYLINRANSAICQYLRLERQAPLGRNPFLAGQWERLCEPFETVPNPPPVTENFDAGGVPCRLYRVQFVTGQAGGLPSSSVLDRRGPIRLTKVEERNGDFGFVRYHLMGGDGVNCPITNDIIAGEEFYLQPTIYARITNITALEGDPGTEIPVPVPPPEDGTPRPDPPTFNVDVTIDGVEINVPVQFEVPVEISVGPIIPFTFAPTANFNLSFDPQISVQPRFGIDLDLDFTIPLGNGKGNDEPLPETEPVPIPGNDEPLLPVPTEIDLSEVERIVRQYACCFPVTDVINSGQFTFQDANTVVNVNVPANAVCVFLELQPGEHTRVYKFAENGNEYGYGNATTCVDGSCGEFFRLFLDRHVLFFPPKFSSKQLRLSCSEGVVVNVLVGLYVEPEE